MVALGLAKLHRERIEAQAVAVALPQLEVTHLLASEEMAAQAPRPAFLDRP